MDGTASLPRRGTTVRRRPRVYACGHETGRRDVPTKEEAALPCPDCAAGISDDELEPEGA